MNEVAAAELSRLGAKELRAVADGALFSAPAVKPFLKARTVTAIYCSLTFPVPRPKALLGDATFRRLSLAVRGVAEAAQPPLTGLRIAAAGADTPVMRRVAEELAKAVGTNVDQEDGELLVRLRPDPLGTGWEALVRLTARPLTTRRWRVCNLPGGLNAAVAAAMNTLVGLRPTDRYLNLMCGSGTLLVERALMGPSGALVGLELDGAALACAQENIDAAGVADRCQLLLGDVHDPPRDLGLFDVVVADAPWGDAVGSHEENARLHPAILQAAASFTAPGARFALLTHEVKLTGQLVREQDEWRKTGELRVEHGGHTPLLLLLKRL